MHYVAYLRCSYYSEMRARKSCGGNVPPSFLPSSPFPVCVRIVNARDDKETEEEKGGSVSKASIPPRSRRSNVT